MRQGEEMGSTYGIGKGVHGARQTANNEESSHDQWECSLFRIPGFIFTTGAEHSVDCNSS
jgi:hypothetical protein